MAIIQIAFLLVFIYRFLILSLSCIAFGSFLFRKPDFIKSLILKNRYTFLFPVFREEKIILATLKYYEKFLGWFPEVKLLFVTTAKESPKQTENLINKFICESEYKARITCICSPSERGTKATQMNYALDYIRSQLRAMPYIVSFDCDARISWQDFLLTDHFITENSEKAVYSFLPRMKMSIQNFMGKAALLHHGERVLAYEYSASVWSHGLHYPMGATMVFSPLLWRSMDYIPEPNDDLALKYILDDYKLEYATLPYFTEIQAPPDVKNLYRQMLPIFSGVFSYFQTLTLYHVPLTIKKRIRGLCWYLFYLLEFISILFLLSGNIWLVLIFCLQILLDLIFLRQVSFVNFLLHFAGYFVRLSQFIYFLYYQVFGWQDLCQIKTER